MDSICRKKSVVFTDLTRPEKRKFFCPRWKRVQNTKKRYSSKGFRFEPWNKPVTPRPDLCSGNPLSVWRTGQTWKTKTTPPQRSFSFLPGFQNRRRKQTEETDSFLVVRNQRKEKRRANSKSTWFASQDPFFGLIRRNRRKREKRRSSTSTQAQGPSESH